MEFKFLKRFCLLLRFDIRGKERSYRVFKLSLLRGEGLVGFFYYRRLLFGEVFGIG